MYITIKALLHPMYITFTTLLYITFTGLIIPIYITFTTLLHPMYITFTTLLHPMYITFTDLLHPMYITFTDLRHPMYTHLLSHVMYASLSPQTKPFSIVGPKAKMAKQLIKARIVIIQTYLASGLERLLNCRAL